MPKRSVEDIKDESRGLRGTIVPTLHSDATHFTDDDYQLLKFHGTYQQDDRDLRIERKRAGLDKAWSFMVRSKMAGGECTADQYLQHDDIAEDLGVGNLRITTRQGFQIHGILMGGLKDCIARIKDSGLTTLGACGDVVRNTMSPAAPFDDAAHRDAQVLAEEMTELFLPETDSYLSIWLNGEKLMLDEEEKATEAPAEPIYGKHYLPRKFKIAIAVPPRNDVDVFTQDLGFISHVVDGEVEGYTVTVGGGFGMSHGKTVTRPYLAQPLFYVKRAHVLEAAEAVVTTQRDYGNREDRKLARMKYLVASKGIDWFRQEVTSRMKGETFPAKELVFDTVGDALGWHEQGNGKLLLGVWIEEGRVADATSAKYRSAMRELAEKFRLPLRLTPNCNVIYFDIDPKDKDAIDELLRRHNIPHTDEFTEARKTAHACVALPTCGLALAESERVFPSLMDKIDGILRELKLEKEAILFRMTGCPNGCARPYNADIGFVGRAPGKYAFYVGGSIRGDRLVGLEEKTVPFDELPGKVRPVLEEYAANRHEGESFTDYWGRTHVNGEEPSADQFHVELAARAERMAAAKAAKEAAPAPVQG
ncbi:MAG: NADPH-dependent assimilatory sulfite reductase hemoprotein subunit [Verrucomicrobiota bacterium]